MLHQKRYRRDLVARHVLQKTLSKKRTSSFINKQDFRFLRRSCVLPCLFCKSRLENLRSGKIQSMSLCATWCRSRHLPAIGGWTVYAGLCQCMPVRNAGWHELAAEWRLPACATKTDWCDCTYYSQECTLHLNDVAVDASSWCMSTSRHAVFSYISQHRWCIYTIRLTGLVHSRYHKCNLQSSLFQEFFVTHCVWHLRVAVFPPLRFCQLEGCLLLRAPSACHTFNFHRPCTAQGV